MVRPSVKHAPCHTISDALLVTLVSSELRRLFATSVGCDHILHFVVFSKVLSAIGLKNQVHSSRMALHERVVVVPCGTVTESRVLGHAD